MRSTMRHPRSPAAQADQARPRRDRDGGSCGDRYRPLGPERESVSAADLQIAGRCVAHAHSVLRVDRQQRRPGRRWRGEGGRGEIQGGTAVGDQDPLGRRARGDRSRHRRRHRQGQGRAPAGGRRLPVGVRRQQSLFDRRGDQGRAGARGSRLPVVRGARRVLPCQGDWARSRSGWTSRCRPASSRTRCSRLARADRKRCPHGPAGHRENGRL